MGEGGGQLRVQVGRVGAVSQVEVNQDLDAKMHGLCVHFVTTARGRGAQNRARAPMSGFQIPFIRK